MKLHHLQALTGAVEHGSIRAAARAMHLTQAALTKSLRQLEEEHNLALLVRRPSGIALTPAGERLHARARYILRQLQLAQDEMQEASLQAQGLVRVGLTPFLLQSVMGEAFAWFRKRYPMVALGVVEGLVSRSLPSLRDGSMDFAVVADSGDLGSGDFERVAWWHETQSLVVRRGHPALRKPDAQRLRALEWVLPGPMGAAQDPSVLSMFAAAGVAPPSLFTHCDAMAAMALVRQSDAVCIMPTPLLASADAHGLVALVCPGLTPPGVELVQISPAGVPLSPPADYLARCIRDAAQAQRQP